jgi:Peptidase inhibitor family I36
VPRGVATALERQVCRVTGGADCPAAEASEGPSGGPGPWRLAYAPANPDDPEPRTPVYGPNGLYDPDDEWISGGIKPYWRIPRDGGPESDAWQDCPAEHLCLYGGENYQELIYSEPITGTDGFSLPQDVKNRTGSWVNNSRYDLCGANRFLFGNVDEEPFPGTTHPEGRNRATQTVFGDSVEYVSGCTRAGIDPEPLVPPEEGGPDCPPETVCFYDGADFTDPIYQFPVGDAPSHDFRHELPEGVRGRVSSWANNSMYALCAVDDRRWRGDVSTRLRFFSPMSNHYAQRRALPPGEDNTYDFIDWCGS